MKLIGELVFKPKLEEKRWSIDKELELLKLWEQEGHYEFRDDSSKPLIVIDTPPPYPSGPWHVGGLAHYCQIDMIARYFRMRGYSVLVPFYADRNGLPVEVAVEKKYGINPRQVPREQFLELCRKFLDEMEEQIVRQWKRAGCVFTYWRSGTDSPEYRAITQATFIELWRRGLIYEAERPVSWCPRCQTSISEAEIEYEERDTWLCYIKFKVEETGEDIVIATTRPELLCTCALVIFNPEDTRYQHLEGKHAIVPIFGQKVPIKKHPSARPEFGTGLVMVCSFGDWTDVQLFKEFGLKPKIAIDSDGRMNEVAGPYRGLRVEEARAKIIEDLEKSGLLVKKERLKHAVPVCWRCKTPIEFIITREFFVKQLEFKEALKKLAYEMKFCPEQHRQLLLQWIDSITMDWPITRTRFYGTEVPIWYCKRCGTPHLPEPGRYYQPWREKAPFERCVKCGCTEFVGETRVFDTWFDSSISVLYVCGYLRNKGFFERALRSIRIRPQGYDIVRTWLYFSTLRVYQLLGIPAFTHVRISGMGLDEKGEAMHKSKGNVIYPEPYLEKYGADVFRFWAAAAAKLGSDYRFSEQLLKTGSLFLTKLWNIARFISSFPEPANKYKLRPIDYMILGALNDVIRKCINSMNELDFYDPINEVYRFTWDIFADHYLEAVKARAYNRDKKFSEEEQRGAWYTLHTVLKTVLKLLAPICPFITDYIWRKLYSEKSIHFEKFPEPNPEWDTPYRELLSRFMDFNSKIWTLKKNMKIALNQPLRAKVYIPRDLEPIADDLKAMHQIQEIVIGEPQDKTKVKDLGSGIYVELLQ